MTKSEKYEDLHEMFKNHLPDDEEFLIESEMGTEVIAVYLSKNGFSWFYKVSLLLLGPEQVFKETLAKWNEAKKEAGIQ